jgi:peptidoglycan/LPS O-acetylase OafA/YrhL
MYHAFSRWPEITPYGDDFSDFIFFKYGYLGVQLFFLISGFVILMTLEKCNSIPSFIYRRWLRLFPAMLICSLLIYFSSSIFYERPSSQPAAIDLLAGLSFIDPYIWLKVTGMELKSIEGAFWSIYVEFKFYIIASILYFSLGSKRLVITLFLCFLTWVLSSYFNTNSDLKEISMLYSVTSILGFEYFGWFAAGAAYYYHTKSNHYVWFIAGALFSIVSSLVESNLKLGPFLACTTISIFFALSLVSTQLQTILCNRFFLFFGTISYPLYLIHENMMISMTIQAATHIDFIPAFIFPALSIALISTLAFFIATKAEPQTKNFIKSNLSALRKVTTRK